MSERQQDTGKDSKTLEREIDETRAEIEQTTDALLRRFSPGELLDQSLGLIRRHGGEFAGNLGTSVKQNPLAILLTSAGLAWLITSDGRSENSHSPVGESFSSTREKASQAAEGVKERAAGVVERFSRAKERIAGGVSHGTDTVSARAASVNERFQTTLEERPLVLGALGLALGAVLGGILPRSEIEDRLMGSASERTKETLKEQGKQACQEARNVVESAASETVAAPQSSGDPHR